MNKNILYLFAIVMISSLVSCNDIQEIKDEKGNVLETFTNNKDNEKEGIYKRFNSEGDLLETANYIAGKLEGKRSFYYNTGQIELVEYYSGDIIDGECVGYYKNGQIKLMNIYHNGVMNSMIKKYSENGVLLEIVQMKDNEENGPFKEYYENGQIKWEGEYIKGDNEIGLIQNYNENGELVKKLKCDTMTTRTNEFISICRTIWTVDRGDIELKPLDMQLNKNNK